MIRTWLAWMTARTRALFRSSDDDQDFGLELEAHIAMLAEDHMRAGMTADEAQRQARLQVGGIVQLQQAHREERTLPFVDSVAQDLRYTLRTLRRDAAFAIFAILIIGIGIGASSTVLSVVNAVLLRPLPFDSAERLVWISNIADNKVDEWQIQVGHYLDMRTQTKAFSDLAAYFADSVGREQVLTGRGEPVRLSGVQVSQNFLPFLGVQPLIGRQFTADECKWNGPRAVLLSYQLWRTRYASDPAIVGRAIVLNDTPATVAGVLPESFNFSTVFHPGASVDLYMPFPLSRETDRWGNILVVIGRLKLGATIETARAEFEVLGKQLAQQHLKDRNDLRPKLTPLAERINGRFRPALLVLAWAVGVVMLIVCANLANLQLSRMATRKREMAVRFALGAGRGRLIRQLLTESIVLSCAGAAIGLIFSFAATRILARLDTFNIPLLESVRVDSVALSFTMFIAVATGVLFGLLPALQVPGLAVHGDLKDGSRGMSEGRGRGWLRNALVVSEIAFACVLLVGAGLLIRSFLHVLDVNLGFEPQHASALRIDPSSRFPDQEKRRGYYMEALRLVRGAPGVDAAGLADVLPLGGNRSRGVAGIGQVYARDRYPQGFIRTVSEGYFQALGVPVRAGRDFNERDTAASEPVVILNEMLARVLWPGQNPIGQVINEGRRRVVGIVGNVRHKALEEGFTGEMYLPMRQSNEYATVDVVVRTRLSTADMAAGVRAALSPIATNLPESEWRPLRTLIDKAISPRRFVVLLLGGFSAFALILASLGIYGVVSYSVNQRTQEIGIRMALGASAQDLQVRIIWETLRLAAVGMLLGFSASWVLAQALTGMLFDLTPADPVTFAGIAFLLTAVAAAAGYLPSRRASLISPVVALRAN